MIPYVQNFRNTLSGTNIHNGSSHAVLDEHNIDPHYKHQDGEHSTQVHCQDVAVLTVHITSMVGPNCNSYEEPKYEEKVDFIKQIQYLTTAG